VCHWERVQCWELLLLQERRREYSLKSPGIKPQASVSARHNLISSQQSISSVINGSFSTGSASSLFGSASTLSSRRHVPSSLPSTVDDEMDADSLSSGTTTPMTTPTTTDSEFNMSNPEDDSSVFSHTVSSSTSGCVSGSYFLWFLLVRSTS